MNNRQNGDQDNKRMPYEAPQARDLWGLGSWVALGQACSTGSIAQGNCTSGAQPRAQNCVNGPNAGISCISGSKVGQTGTSTSLGDAAPRW